MLSKLSYYKNNKVVSADNDRLVSALTEALSSKYKTVRIEPCKPGGTLGIFFFADLEGKRKFIKTHLPGKNNRANIVKEIKILDALYGDLMIIQNVESALGEDEFTFLIMDQLTVLSERPNLKTMREIINEYNRKLDNVFDCIGQNQSEYSFQQICDEAVNAAKILAAERLISYEIYCQSLECIQRYSEIKEPYSLCHGDLSNKNLMLKDDKLVVIDWEDAFWGIRNYDLYYWLTFFDQRRYYSLKEFTNNQIDIRECIDCMATVTILKCFLSYKNGTYKDYSLSFNQRMLEILNINNK